MEPRYMIRAAATALSLATATGAFGQSASFSNPFSASVAAYGFFGLSGLQFIGGGNESGVLLGFGMVLADLATGGSLPGLSHGVEISTLNLTGTGAGWGVDQLRGAVHVQEGNHRVTALAGLARTRTPATDEYGYTFGLRYSYAPSTGTPPVQDTVAAGQSGGGETTSGPDGYPLRSPAGPQIFIQADYNDTGTYRTTQTTFGFSLNF